MLKAACTSTVFAFVHLTTTLLTQHSAECTSSATRSHFVHGSAFNRHPSATLVRIPDTFSEMADPAPAAKASSDPRPTISQTAQTTQTTETTPTPSQTPRPMTKTDVEDATNRLAASKMFRRCSRDEISGLAQSMHKLSYNRGDLIVTQSEPADKMLVMAEGFARRLRKGRDGVERQLDTTADGALISGLHVTSGDPIYSTAKCVTQTCSAYAMSRAAFRRHLQSSPQLATQVIDSLSYDIRETTRRFRTPLLSQRTKEINVAAVSIAAVTESYYRSALNSVLNQRLSGLTSPLFPNMHVQVPARVLYITGFKGLRSLFDRVIDPDKWNTHSARVTARITNMIAPGVVMTPVASILEACNAGHANPEPLAQRAMRGIVPRCGREIVFGVGLNQLSDYFEERYRSVTSNSVIANTSGSITAGVVAGYLSHVPHNISTYKLMNPQKSYSELFRMFVDKSVPEHLVPKNMPESALPATKTLLACLFPRGVLIRTVQICGSFAILNGLITMIEKDNRRRMGKALQSAADDGGDDFDFMASESVD